MTNLLDICERKHKGNEQSRQAFKGVRVTEGQQAVLDALAVKPMTSKEVAYRLGKPLNAISGRFSELKRKDLIRATGNVRCGSMEMRRIT